MGLSNLSEVKQTCFIIFSYIMYSCNQAQPWLLHARHAIIPSVCGVKSHCYL